MTDTHQKPTHRSVVVIPTYNEAANIAGIVERTLAATPGTDVLVVDDNSPDGTGRMADELAARHARVHTLHRAGKEGLGSAYRAGFDWALEHEYDAVVEMDADGSHEPEEVPRLLTGLEIADMSIGSRWVPGGGTENWPARRHLLSRGGNLYARRALGLRLRDATGGFRAFRRSALERIGYREASSQGYCFQVELAHRGVDAGLRVIEVPIVFRDREHGQSKMSWSIVAEAMWRVSEWAVQRQSRRLALAFAR
jgi:dolichol-phosphate mannosyltransferase